MMDKAAVAAVAAALLASAPALAATSVNSPAARGSQTERGSKAADAQEIVNDATRTIGQMKSDPQFDQLVKQAKGVFIVPKLVKGAVVVGGQGGQGVLLARQHGQWSDPAFLSIGSVSLGPQVGGKAGPLVMLLMTDKALNDFTEHNNFSLNANAGLTIVNYSARGQGTVGKGDIIVWSGASGAFVGVNVSGTDITTNTTENQNFYGRKVATRDIINGAVSNAQADKLRDALPA